MACIKNLSFQILTISRVEKPSRWQLTALKTRTKLAWSECYVLCCAHLWRGWQCRLSGCGWPRRWWRAPPQASTRHPPACLSQPGAGSNLIQDCKYYEPNFFWVEQQITDLHTVEPLPDLRGLLEAGAGVWHGGGRRGLGNTSWASEAHLAHFTGPGLELQNLDSYKNCLNHEMPYLLNFVIWSEEKSILSETIGLKLGIFTKCCY